MTEVTKKDRYRARLRAIDRILSRAFCACDTVLDDPLDVLVRTILSQNTADSNSIPVFMALKKSVRSWDDILQMPVAVLAARIQRCGLSRIKAGYIKKSLVAIRARAGRLSLDHLHAETTRQAYSYLTGLPGVGPKTAAVVLVFAFGRPLMPVDTHIYRICCRIGLFPSGTPVAHAQELLSSIVVPHRIHDLHLHLIRHGRDTCHARRPRCDVCPIRRYCAYGNGPS